MKKVRVLIVDDSALIREMFQEILNSDDNIEVIGTANDPLDARQKIKSLDPDVITLDIEMPKMDGISFLKKIMSLRPTPVVMVSSLTQKGARATLDALEIGAVDYVSKSSSSSFDIDNLSHELISKVKAAARAKVNVVAEKVGAASSVVGSKKIYHSNTLIAIGASTGGVEALRSVISAFPKNSPPILIVQHMPENFTTTFADRLNGYSELTVHEAADGMVIEKGHAYLAPGSDHMELAVDTLGRFACRLNKKPPFSGHRPSVDVLFSSVAKIVKEKAVGVILTGMGKDGAIGMLEMKKSGSYNIGQNEDSCVVYGMPKAAYLSGAVDIQLPLGKIVKNILDNCA